MIGVFNKLANIDAQMLNLKNSLVYTVVLILLLFFFGVLFSVIERINSRAINNVFGRTGLIITGVIGTVVHEFSFDNTVFSCYKSICNSVTTNYSLNVYLGNSYLLSIIICTLKV